MQYQDEGSARRDRLPVVSRAMIGRATGLDWVQTCVLKAACDVARRICDRRLTLDQVQEHLALATQISRAQIEAALGPLCARGYLIADDDPHNPEIVVHVMRKALEEYCYRFVRGYGRINLDLLRLACQGVGVDAAELAHRSGHDELLVEHVLAVAAGNGLLRLVRSGPNAVVTEIKPQLRRLVSGAA
jgi:hypothetical protein